MLINHNIEVLSEEKNGSYVQKAVKLFILRCPVFCQQHLSLVCVLNKEVRNSLEQLISQWYLFGSANGRSYGNPTKTCPGFSSG